MLGIKRPIIGITPKYNHEDGSILIKECYCSAVLRSGGTPMILPHSSEEGALDAYLDICDGIILSGGPDIDAKNYREDNYIFNGRICPIRDSAEIYLAKTATFRDKPILGICRGMQVLNVALGGTLYQDIHEQIRDKIVLKHAQDSTYWHPIHEIHIQEDTKIHKSFGTTRIGVNSSHHQAVKDVARDLVVTATTSDGIIEAVEHKSKKYIIGVQWHPELMWQKNEVYLGVFKDFLNSC